MAVTKPTKVDDFIRKAHGGRFRAIWLSGPGTEEDLDESAHEAADCSTDRGATGGPEATEFVR